ncbi:helix-turn-helix domain containing protein [Paenibacillus sp. ACRRY]|uniref:helix-turn-helix domain containing protein n=1 Tax=Paenibacillus sp. ACRRY TaxID=2918208 RepID=UPI001EF42438|nr:helix-turn-helix domain containing protein [Paenibacillus sp. ACRRY]MCG7385068.1 helix-turn-helix domain containing protein [Paenibacillus sp. ACRRY]
MGAQDAKANKWDRIYTTKSGISKIHIACEELNFTWRIKDVLEFREMWEQNHSLTSIAKYFRRPVLELFVLAVDQANLNKITSRPSGIFGGESSWKD